MGTRGIRLSILPQEQRHDRQHRPSASHHGNEDESRSPLPHGWQEPVMQVRPHRIIMRPGRDI